MRVLWLLALVPAVGFASPFNLTHSGRLLDSIGTPIDGNENLQVRLYDATGQVFFDHTYMQQPIDNGYYAVMLTDVDSDAFTGSVEIGVTLVGQGEMARQPLTSVPHALAADVATRLAVSETSPVGSCGTEGTMVWDRERQTVRVCNEAGSWTAITPSSSVDLPSSYDKVLTMESNGTVSFGTMSDAVDRVTVQAQDCVIRWDDRMGSAEYIEFNGNDLRFDFQPLYAYHNSWDAYAFAMFEEGTRAGTAGAYRRGHAADVWKTSEVQHTEAAYNAHRMHLYCDSSTTYSHLAEFNSGGNAVQGSWQAVYDAVQGGAMCKVRWDGRLHEVHHVEYGANEILFDFLGLQASHNTHDAYAYVRVTNNSAAGLASAYRRGHSGNDRSYVRGYDREQNSGGEQYFQGKTVDVYCDDSYSDHFALDAAGNMTQGTWSELHTAVVDEARDCRVRYDNRVSTPRYIEYGSDFLQLDLTGLTAWHASSSWDSYVSVRMSHQNYAGIDSNYRRGTATEIWKKSIDHHPWQGITTYPVDVFCKADAYTPVLSLSSGGIVTSGNDFSDYYTAMRDLAEAPQCKLRYDDRVTIPEAVEDHGSGFYFDQQPFAAQHGSWQSFTTFNIAASTQAGSWATYRKANSTDIQSKGRVQHNVANQNPFDVDVMCR